MVCNFTLRVSDLVLEVSLLSFQSGLGLYHGIQSFRGFSIEFLILSLSFGLFCTGSLDLLFKVFFEHAKDGDNAGRLTLTWTTKGCIWGLVLINRVLGLFLHELQGQLV